MRLTFTSKILTQQFTAGFETAKQTTEAANFLNYPSSSHINVVASNAHSGSNSEYLNGAASGQVGVAKSFSVMPGDVVSIQAYATYLAPTNTPSNIAGFAAALLGAFNLPAPGQGEFGTPSSAINSWGSGEAAAFGDGTSDQTDPKVFVTIVIFDRSYNYVDVAYQQLTSSGVMNATYKVKQPGYAYMYVSNEEPNQRDVYFDDITMTFTPSPVVQQEDFYPFGLSFNSYSRENIVPQNFLFQETEFIADLGLNLQDFDARFYDAALGRTPMMDPNGEDYPEMSPYDFLENNPINVIDPSGMDGINLEGGTNVNAKCETCPTNDPKYKPFIDDPNHNYIYDPKTGEVSTLLSEVTVTGSRPPSVLPNEPMHEQFGDFEYFWSGGIDNGIKYDKSGIPLYPVTIGEAPDVGLGKGIKALKHLHHSFPKFLGGLKNQKLTKMSAELHKALHKELNAFLRRFGMAPSRANPGRKIIQSNTPTEIEKALTEFYKGPGAKYKEAAEDFFKYIER